jgi:cytochrome c553
MLLAATAAAAAAEPAWRQALAERLAYAEKDPAAWKALLEKGEDRAFFCAYCHGKDGNRVMPLVPNLAGQNPYYLLEQIEKFASGEREDDIMSPLARQFSAEERVLIAIYYSSQVPRPYVADASLAAEGRERYEALCVRCHGADARGSDRYARLAGQRVEYLRHRLFQFQQPAAAPTVMHGIASLLSDAEIRRSRLTSRVCRQGRYVDFAPGLA